MIFSQDELNKMQSIILWAVSEGYSVDNLVKSIADKLKISTDERERVNSIAGVDF